jgi:hypothetical protein
VAWPAQEPVPSLVELTFAAGRRGAEVKLENMHGIHQDSEGQPPQGFRPATIPATAEELSR